MRWQSISGEVPKISFVFFTDLAEFLPKCMYRILLEYLFSLDLVQVRAVPQKQWFLLLIQAYLPDTPETVIIVGFCKRYTGFNIHPFGTVLTIPDLFCPLSDSDLLSYKAGLRRIPPLNHSQQY